jgi:O-acetyl-ADP-ribose deacetylase (regulator of RNase III)
MKTNIDIVFGDICNARVDGIICQANTDLELEDKITTRLIEQGQQDIRDECNQFDSQQKGSAIATTAGKLPAKFLLHTVTHNIGETVEEEDMMLAIRNALNLAKAKMLKSVAMPLMGIGNSGISIRRAAELMLAEVKRHLESESPIERVLLVVDDEADYWACEEAFRQL